MTLKSFVRIIMNTVRGQKFSKFIKDLLIESRRVLLAAILILRVPAQGMCQTFCVKISVGFYTFEFLSLKIVAVLKF